MFGSDVDGLGLFSVTNEEGGVLEKVVGFCLFVVSNHAAQQSVMSCLG